MIKNKSDLEYYLAEEAKANDIIALSSYEQFLTFFDPNLLWCFNKYLRKHKYYLNRIRVACSSELKGIFFLCQYKKTKL